MREYVTNAIVLSREVQGEKDSRVSLFTEKFGKLSARVKSARNILSKLSGHIEPGSVVMVRLLEMHGLQLVDALQTAKSEIALDDLLRIDAVANEGEPEPLLWEMMKRNTIDWRTILSQLGWDAAYARCIRCGKSPYAFGLRAQEFFCTSCASKIPSYEVVYVL